MSKKALPFGEKKRHMEVQGGENLRGSVFQVAGKTSLVREGGVLGEPVPKEVVWGVGSIEKYRRDDALALGQLGGGKARAARMGVWAMTWVRLRTLVAGSQESPYRGRVTFIPSGTKQEEG